MILDIDHIALSSNDFNSVITLFEKLNYEIAFTEKKISNLKIKQKLMKNFPPFHDLCLMTSKFNVNIELINYNKFNQVDGFIIPIFETSELKILQSQLHFLQIPNVLKQSKNHFVFNKFVIQSHNIEQSIFFWNELGFKNLNPERNQFLFESIFSSKKYELFIKFTKIKKDYLLDNSGWPCIAFLTNSIVNEKDRLSEYFETTKIESILINKKELKIFFVKGPSNELVEIISVQ